MQGKTVVLGVSGGIAAYKACDLASRLTQQGATVPVVMTAAAARFVTPLTFQALTHQPVHASLWPESHESKAGVYAAMAHIGLAEAADVVLIAPASANLIARLAHGLADDLLTTLVLATRAPVLVAPAMNPLMLAHPATQRNLAALRELGYIVIDPETGRMACEHVGVGRLPPTDVLLTHLCAALEPRLEAKPDAPSTPRDWAKKKLLVTAGPTRESIDPVRFISNRSSGKMGYALAEAAASRGAEVVLVSGPSRLETPPGVRRVDVTTTDEMCTAVLAEAPSCHVLIAAAAPADFRPAAPVMRKIKKHDLGEAALHLELVPTPDIVAEAARRKPPGQIVVGFAAETHLVVEEAHRKLAMKGLDAIVANDVTQSGAGFDTDTNRVTWLTPNATEEWPLLSKREVAARILDRIVALLNLTPSPSPWEGEGSHTHTLRLD